MVISYHSIKFSVLRYPEIICSCRIKEKQAIANRIVSAKRLFGGTCAIFIGSLMYSAVDGWLILHSIFGVKDYIFYTVRIVLGFHSVQNAIGNGKLALVALAAAFGMNDFG